MTNVKIIACKTICDEVESLRGDIEVEYCEGFLHDTPEKLRDTLNERIAATAGDGTILLAYGRCSMAPPVSKPVGTDWCCPQSTTASLSCWARAGRTSVSSRSTPAPTTTRAVGSRSSRIPIAST